MMPYHSLALLAILALGFLWLLGVQTTDFVTFVQSYIGHALLIDLFLLLVQNSTMDDGKLTRTIYFNHLGSQSTSQVRVHRSNPSSHRCNWRCHQNFDNNNCPILCGDRCKHPYCTNCRHPDLFPPPNPTPSTSASLPFQTTPALIPRQYQQSIQVPSPQSIYPSNTQTFIDTPYSYGLIHHSSSRALPRGPSSNSPNTFRGDRVNGAQISFRELVDGLEGVISDSVLTYRRRHRIANCHGVRHAHQDAGSNPVRSFPHMRCSFSSHSSPSHWVSMLGRLDMARIRARRTGSEEEDSTLYDPEQGPSSRPRSPESS